MNYQCLYDDKQSFLFYIVAWIMVNFFMNYGNNYVNFFKVDNTWNNQIEYKI